MSANEVHLNDVGTVFKYSILDEDSNVVDVSTASSINIYFKKPGYDTVSKSGTLYTDGTDGIVYYTIASGDLNVVGNWYTQVEIVISDTNWRSDIQTFNVYENL